MPLQDSNKLSSADAHVYLRAYVRAQQQQHLPRRSQSRLPGGSGRRALPVDASSGQPRPLLTSVTGCLYTSPRHTLNKFLRGFELALQATKGSAPRPKRRGHEDTTSCIREVKQTEVWYSYDCLCTVVPGSTVLEYRRVVRVRY